MPRAAALALLGSAGPAAVDDHHGAEIADVQRPNFHVIPQLTLSLPWAPASASAWRPRPKASTWPVSFNAEGKACSHTEMDKEAEAEEEVEDESADLMAHTAREQAIHEAVAHAEKATNMAKDAAEVILSAANEAMQARRVLDAHDVITIENQTQADVQKAEVARGMEEASESQVPWPLCVVPPPPIASQGVPRSQGLEAQAQTSSCSDRSRQSWRSRSRELRSFL
mmetsp:Transcript_153375/g.278728  ORF Transcript_153375/g.278728 Transcript_153375/m.278728 type:complete len:226 (+) Transcript_153375:3-680(+)